ncbi:Phosphopantothenoylcysteine decarboxylase; Phosphopantothenate-cysteine ligase [Oceanithermus profundus DSM 14977]|uniref:Coenzyme A biosynthesis bifunctional protein CoaBC n=1 Tax=Oceanithermus profundus (strain DSM 14977 / NBRC 100410 / VKM B-2274 / 506) TaxID=670487 RepID=E4U9B5_OCEP5|nr:bifunctional phosphopantothenoylcysteine decarboxylase/phosphopantothenate--cysteine ligase CoaBC [Oceanithermus profundus]ADR36944.1 Phosphopantothenoylcysteine decarboxylase; Phosphopantothenate-cysteine ligase [Oceanithermus profundus DSM 14977]
MSRSTSGRVVVAAGGGVAAMKTPFLLRRLREAGFEVRALASDRALAFTTETALAVAAGGPVATEARWFAAEGDALHLDLARWADLLVVAPATAAGLARAAAGLAEDLTTATILGGARKVLWAPAMNPEMWQHPATQANVERLRAWGHAFVGPEHGALAAVGEGEGLGRMSEPETIVEHVRYHLTPKDLEGYTVLVTAGPTREYFDPVRFISNPSSGKMGYAVAEAARDRGARVILVSGPTALPAPWGVEVVHVERAEEMHAAVLERFPETDAVVMAAAVADWRPARTASEKTPKQEGKNVVELAPTPDILAELGRRKAPGQVLVGFAMETRAGRERARAKLERKNLDLIALNFPTRAGSAFGGDHNEVELLFPDGRVEATGRVRKRAVAERVLDHVRELLIAKEAERDAQ